MFVETDASYTTTRDSTLWFPSIESLSRRIVDLTTCWLLVMSTSTMSLKI